MNASGKDAKLNNKLGKNNRKFHHITIEIFTELAASQSLTLNQQ